MKLFFFSLFFCFRLTTLGQNDSLRLEDATGLKVGEMIPFFEAANQEDSLIKISDILKKGPVVLVFYRGQWCPFCNKHLAEIQDSLEILQKKGVNVVAISPEKPEYLAKMEKKLGVTFTLLYDKNYLIAKQFDILFEPDQLTKTKYNTLLNADLAKAHENEAELLPIPATFIINTEGKIVWRQVNPDYKKRASIHEIISNLPQ